jgi:hypothetical protein
MRFATRTFLWSFIPFVILLLGSFWAIQKLVEHTVRDGLRTSLRQTHASVARVRANSELQNSRFLKILGENSSTAWLGKWVIGTSYDPTILLSKPAVGTRARVASAARAASFKSGSGRE